MKQSIGFNQFTTAFEAHGHSEQFSYEAQRALFDYLEQYEADTGEELELDVIALCCDYSEESPADIIRSYSINITDEADSDLVYDIVLHHLQENAGMAIGLDNGMILYQPY